MNEEFVTLAVGETSPWRLTKESGYRLALALVRTGASVTASWIDESLPRTHACLRILIRKEKTLEFSRIFKSSVSKAEEMKGQ